LPAFTFLPIDVLIQLPNKSGTHKASYVNETKSKQNYKMNKATLANVLTYHVVSGKYNAADIIKLKAVSAQQPLHQATA